MNSFAKKAIVAIIVSISFYRLVTLLFSDNSFEYKMLLSFGILTFIFFVLTASSCYYFRHFSAKNIQPNCSEENNCPACTPEGTFEKMHRFFYWATFFLVFLHFIFAFWFGFVFQTDPFFFFTAVSLGASYLLWLFSCRYFKYFFQEKLRGFHPKSSVGKFSYGFYGVIKKIYPHHSVFFWLVVMFVVLHLILVFLRRI